MQVYSISSICDMSYFSTNVNIVWTKFDVYLD